MNVEQKAKVHAVIDKDCTGISLMLDGKKMCILGGLLNEIEESGLIQYQATPNQKQWGILRKVYGITLAIGRNLIQANDSRSTVPARRKLLHKLIDKMPVS